MRDILSLEYGSALPEKDRVDGKYPVYGSNGVVGHHKDYYVKGPGIIIGRKGSAGAVNWCENDFFPIDTTYYVVANEKKVIFRYLYFLLEKLNIPKMIVSAAVPGLNRELVYNISYNLPPLSTQRQIVEKLDKQMQALEGVRMLKSEAQKRIEEILAGVWGE